MYLPVEDLTYLSIPLPEEVKMYHYTGDFEGEIACIERWLQRNLPASLRRRLEIQSIFANLLKDDYPLSTAEFLAALREKCPSATEATIDAFVDMAMWILC